MEPEDAPSSAGFARPKTYAEIPGALRSHTRLQMGPIFEFVGEFGWGMVLLMVPTLFLAVQALLDLSTLKFDIPPAKARYDGSGSSSLFIWKQYTEVYLGGAALAAMAFFSLRQWARAMRSARRVEDLPTSTVRAAAQGEIEIRGKVAALQTGSLQSKLSGTPCVWYWYQIQHKVRNSKGQSSNVIVAEDQSPAPIVIDDGTGIAIVRLVQAHRASLDTAQSHPEPGVTHSERLIREGDDLFIWGTLESWDVSAPPQDLDVADIAAIEKVRQTRYPDQDAGSSMAVVRPMPDGTPVAVALKGQNPLVAHYRFNARVCAFFAVLALVAIALFQRVAWLAVH